VRTESRWTVGAALVVSVGLAAPVWRWLRRWVLAAVVVFAAGAVVLDIAEAGHQFGEDRVGVAVLAILVAVANAAVVGVAGLLLRSAGGVRPG
jgi:hypothetical protein